jgi:hypothetical protein
MQLAITLGGSRSWYSMDEFYNCLDPSQSMKDDEIGTLEFAQVRTALENCWQRIM